MLMEFDRLTFAYTSTQPPIVEQFSLQMKTKQRYALIGHNGCGKTTLLRLANGLYQPSQGKICLEEKPLKYDRVSLAKWRQNIGLVFQNPEQQLVATTVEEDLAYGLSNLGLPHTEIKQRVDRTLQEFDLSELADFPVNYLSLGQKKRLAIADVMIMQPLILLLDEPTAYLDPSQTKQLHHKLEQIYQQGTTILIATHNLDFVYSWADWLFVMNQGKLVIEGTPAQVFTQQKLLKQLHLDIPTILKVIRQLKQTQENLSQLNPEQIRTIFRDC